MDLPFMNIFLFLSLICTLNPIFSLESCDLPDIFNFGDSNSNPTCSLEGCNFPAIFNFGDSNSDTGGLSATSLITVPPPFGNTYFHMPAGRGSDGRHIIDFIAQSFGLPFLHGYLDSLEANFSHGANFATGGAAINGGLLKLGGFNFYLNIQYDQFRQFKLRSQIIKEKGRIFAALVPKQEYFSNALYTFDIGMNDLFRPLLANFSVQEVNASIPNIINDFVTNVKNAYNLGGRSFWIHNTGPLGCLAYSLEIFPSGKKDDAGCVKLYNEVAQYFNYMLREVVLQLRQDFPEAAFTYVDIYSVKYSLFKQPERYGFELPLVACCGHGGKYNFTVGVFCGDTITINGTQISVDSCERPDVRVIWDGVHYTDATNKFVFDQISTGAFSDPPIPLRMACHRNTSFFYNHIH
ncbi:esterase-like [Tripterygium wilfordii]|uniref:esterase-like n=1 Tax=Tripterygium wilfordii TaxID=458696 RepID=UPI0018F84B96|nr:esterase-like [Tripterygium wilfordii]